MKKRCFIIAAIAIVVGVICQIQAQPTEALVRIIEQANESNKIINERIENAERGDFNYGRPYESSEDPYATDSTFIVSSYVSFGLAGVLLIAGFVIGPPKEGDTTETQVDSVVE